MVSLGGLVANAAIFAVVFLFAGRAAIVEPAEGPLDLLALWGQANLLMATLSLMPLMFELKFDLIHMGTFSDGLAKARAEPLEANTRC